MDIILRILEQSWMVLNDSAPYVLFGLGVAGLLKALLPDDFVGKHLGGTGSASVFKAALFGAPLPLCSCGVLPVAIGLRRQGASKGATASFLISTPETGVDSIAITYALLDPVMTVIRPISAVITAATAGLVLNLFPDKKDNLLDMPLEACSSGCCSDSACSDNVSSFGPGNGLTELKVRPPLSARLKSGMRDAFGDMLQDIGSWLLIGIVIAGAIAALIPETFFEEYLGGGFTPMLIMLVIGIPLYVCATASTPIAAALALKGLSPGAALVFLLAGPATNAATITVLAKTLGRRFIVVYLATIAIAALVLGVVVNWVYLKLGISISSWAHGTSEEGISIISLTSSIILLVLVAKPWVLKLFGKKTGHSHSH